MEVLNVHERVWSSSAEEVGQVLDSLGTDHDVLWPHKTWPPVRFDRPVRVGDDTGHGPIRYRIEEYEPGRRIRLRFTSPPGFAGTHEFEVLAPRAGTAGLRHRTQLQTRGLALVSWPFVIRPLHDALIEDALGNAERACGGTPPPRRWSLWVRVLRATWQVLPSRGASRWQALGTTSRRQP